MMEGAIIRDRQTETGRRVRAYTRIASERRYIVTDRQTGRQTDRQQTDRQTDRQTDGQTDRQADKQTDRSRQTDRQISVKSLGVLTRESVKSLGRAPALWAITQQSPHHTDTKTDDHPTVQRQASLQKISEVTTVIPEDSIIVYTDSSLQDTDAADCAFVGYSGIQQDGIMGAINYLLDEKRSGLVISDNLSGLESTTSPHNLANSACTLPIPDDVSTITPGRVKKLLKEAALQIINEERSERRGASVSVRHYD
ncbi:glycosyltransferase-like 12 [Homarus americanus]|uniref:Glycosyltransferase-like 12 n=1 Tax=Homarus americanus TaxID=6706 RepID=A0A8J5TKJ6_HOMAM|nr:glycosyltransferase-like 12 [Homarus americanus]